MKRDNQSPYDTCLSESWSDLKKEGKKSLL